MAKAIIVAIVVVVVMAVIVSLFNRDGREGFWKFRENDGFTVLAFGVLAFILVFLAGKVVLQSVFWLSVVRTLPYIVIIIAIWAYADTRVRDSYDRVRARDDEPWDDKDIVYPWDEDDEDEDEDHVTWPWDE